MNDIIKFSNEIVNINNTTSFTNSQNILSKTELQIKDEVIEMIYQRHLEAQKWGNKIERKKRNINKNFTLNLTREQLQAFSPDEIKTLTKDEIQSFTEKQIKWFTTQQLAKFTTEQFSWFTHEQISALTKKQIKALSDEQLEIKKEKYKEKYYNTRDKEQLKYMKKIPEWTNQFKKYINNEQNLPVINNNNFVANNITSL